METHQIPLGLEFVVDVEDGDLIAAFLCIVGKRILRRSEKRDFLFLFSLSKLYALDDVLLFLRGNWNTMS